MSNSESRKKAATLRQNQIRAKAAAFSPGPTPPRFVADVMLGKLAKWLRIAGFDVLYSNRYTDEELVSLSAREERILLSRDTRLLVQRSVREFIFLESDKIQEQIKQIFSATSTAAVPGLFTRCLTCNEPLTDIPAEEVSDRVPPYVFQTQKNFKFCVRCQKIYWPGTHRQSVLRMLEALTSQS